jgi:hypothetical protein
VIEGTKFEFHRIFPGEKGGDSGMIGPVGSNCIESEEPIGDGGIVRGGKGADGFLFGVIMADIVRTDIEDADLEFLERFALDEGVILLGKPKEGMLELDQWL